MTSLSSGGLARGRPSDCTLDTELERSDLLTKDRGALPNCAGLMEQMNSLEFYGYCSVSFRKSGWRGSNITLALPANIILKMFVAVMLILSNEHDNNTI